MISDRVRARVVRDFGAQEADRILAKLEKLNLPLIADDAHGGRERIHAAILLASRGDSGRVRGLMEMAERDWRDVLVAGGLAHGDWPDRLRDELGP
jgi:hypothetical protein